jgi:protein TonB
MMIGQTRYGDYAKKQKGLRSLTGLSIVVLMHIGLVYLLLSGLGGAMIEVIKGPLETQVIEEQKPKEDVPPPPPPKLTTPPPPFVPPPEISIQAPVTQSANAITSVTRDAPPPPAPPAPKVEDILPKYPSAVSKVNPRYPDRALELGREGEVEIEFTIATDGSVKDAVVVRSVPEGVFDSAAMNALIHWRYTPGEINGKLVEVPGRRAIIKFKLSK